MRKFLWLAPLLLLLLVTPAAATERRPNVVIILADDLGFGDTSAYGAKKISTPNIDRLAREGRLYTDAHSPASVCTPSRYNLLTGRYAWRSWGKSGTVWAPDPMLIDEDRYTLADLFKSEGYGTAVVGKWHLGFGSPQSPGWDDVKGPDYNGEIRPGPLDVGFDYAWVFPHTGQQPHIIIENRRVIGIKPGDPVKLTALRPEYRIPWKERSRDGTVVDVSVDSGKSALYDEFTLSDQITRHATDYIRGQDGKTPFFLYFAQRSPHSPYRPARRFQGKSAIGPYGDMLLELDDSVGEILRAIDEKGFAKDTVVIFTSDNGAIGDYTRHMDHADVAGHARNGPFRGQKTDAYEGGHRIPLIVRWPGKVRPGGRSDAMVALTDVMATFADCFGRRLPANAGEDSFSFLGDLTGRAPDRPRRDTLVSDAFAGVMSMRRGDWKLILAQHGGGLGEYELKPDPSKPAMQLFNLRADPGETTNLYEREPARAAALAAELKRLQSTGRSAPAAR